MAMEAEKPHDLPSASYKPRRECGVIQPEPRGLRTRGTYGVNPSVWAGEDEVSCRKKKGEFLLPLPSVLFVPSMD